ncbi:hypothetical protein [Streptococcus sp. S784/96/1]|uniref:hypothetical protein n=1 Tax=Streptococcus sp. S784/96/1 TaxID=2653499 RepID=UPI001389D0AC|nr:hypothetical protein [Streptococcus sp. S784/96/1]
MKTVKVIALLLFAISLTACSTSEIVNDTIKDVNQTINEVSSEVIEELNIVELFALTDERKAFNLEKPFTREVYLLAAREQLSEMERYNFTLGDNMSFQEIVEESDDDFNIRYGGKTYFSVKKIEVSEMKEISIDTSWEKTILVVLRN